MNKFIRYFLQGLIFTVPLALTIYAIVVSLRFVDGLLSKYVTEVIGFRIPGLGLVIVIMGITLIGILGSSVVIRPLANYADRMLTHAPVINILYTSIKDFMKAFVGKEKKFTEPVLVKVNKDSDLEKMGFITQHDLSGLGIAKGKIAVYLPHSYNFSGNLFIVPVENITPLSANAAEMMKFIVTAGITKVPKQTETD